MNSCAGSGKAAFSANQRAGLSAEHAERLGAMLALLAHRIPGPLNLLDREEPGPPSSVRVLGTDHTRLGPDAAPDTAVAYYFKDDPDTAKIREFYKGHVQRMFELLGQKPRAAKRAAADVWKIESALASLANAKKEESRIRSMNNAGAISTARLE